MTLKEFVLKSLYDNEMTSQSLLNLYYEECEEQIEIKRKNYLIKGKEITESDLKIQIRVELVSQMNTSRYNKDCQTFFIINKIDKPWKYTLSETGKKFYENNYLDIEDDVTIENSEEEIIENINDTGIVYLLKSQKFENTYKIGITTNTIEQRLDSLKRDNRYGVFSLKPIMYIICNDYDIIEKVFHKFFENYRLCKKNDIGVDTELFKNIDSIEEEFELFANFLISNPRFKNVKLIKTINQMMPTTIQRNINNLPERQF